MTTDTLDGRPAVAIGAPNRAGRVPTRLVVRQTCRGALLVLTVAAGMTALVAAQYQSTFADALDGPALQALAANPAIRVLFGPPVALDDPGGFTVWRTGTPVAVLVSVWALLTATRLTRGEEDSGRWNLLLASRTSASAMVTHTLLVLGTQVLIVGGAITVALLLTGTNPTGSALHAAGVVGVGWGFAALGGCAAQVLPSRGAASGAAVGVLGAALLMRMVADGVAWLDWLRWLTPFGLLAETRPYAGDHPAPLLVLVAVPIGLGVSAVLAACCRDLGDGLLPIRTSRRPRIVLLGSVGTFALRRSLRPLAGWALGVSSYFLLIGLLAGSITRFLTENPRFTEFAATAGFGSLGTVAGYAATMFGLLTIPAGIYAAVRLAAAAADETSRRAVLLTAQPLSRLRAAVAEITVAAVGVTVLLTAAALAMWAGTSAIGAPLTIGAALAGALNGAPVALLCLGAAMLAWGARPQHVAAVGSLPAVGGFLLQVLAPSVGAPAWVVEISPYAHLAAVPDSPPDWAATAALTGVAAALGMLGVLRYAHRDLSI
jgi:ABC-2 type transport system permease protein